MGLILLVIEDAQTRALNRMIDIQCKLRRSQSENSTCKLQSLHYQTGNENLKENQPNKTSIAGNPGVSSMALEQLWVFWPAAVGGL